MKLAYIAVHELNAGWGAETFLASAFERLGHEVIRIDYRAHRQELPRLLKEAARQQPDAVLLQRGEGIVPEGLSVFDAPKLYYATEYAGKQEQRELLYSPVFDAIAAASRSTYRCMVEECGVAPERAHWIPSAYDRETYRALAIELRYNVAAVCTRTRRRRKAFRALGWSLRRKKFVAGITGARCNALINQSRVALNVHSFDVLDTETRLFELLPTNAAIVSEECDAPELFAGSGIRWFPLGDWGAMRSAALELLRDEPLRRACVEKNQALALQHDWNARARTWSALIEALRTGRMTGTLLRTPAREAME